MQLRQPTVFLLFSIILFNACAPEGHPLGWNEMDLMPHGLPLSILAPDSAEVKTLEGSNIVQDVSIQKGDEFNIQIFASPAQTTDVAQLKADRLAEVRDNPYFKRIVTETVDGFIFEIKIDDTSSFGFRRIKVQGDREYAFQNGLSSLLTEEQAKFMFEAIE